MSAAAARSRENQPLVVPRRRRQNPWFGRVLLFITCVLVLDAVFGERGLAQTIRARRDFRRAHAALRMLRNENAGLQDEARRLQRDPRTIEAVARQELGLVRPGEILVVIKDLRN